MSKKQKTENKQQPELAAAIEELLKNGTVVLSAKTREELAEMVNLIPANCRYAAGAVGQSYETETYTLRVDLIN